MTTQWTLSIGELRLGYSHCTKLGLVLRDYFDALFDGKFLTAHDALEFTELMHYQCFDLLDDADGNPQKRYYEQRKLAAHRISVVKSRLEAVPIDKARHSAVEKCLAHLAELNRDMECLLREEIALGSELADMNEQVGGSARFRALLEAECPWISWKEVEGIMTTALDSPLAAKWDE
jgi:hypothetical protein